MSRGRFVRWPVGVLLVACAACGGRGAAARVVAPAESATAAAVEAPPGPHTVVVFATASLQEPFTALARRYEQDHPGARVALHCEGGAALLAKALAGAPFDVLAIGDSSLMSRFAGAALLASHSAAELTRSRVAIVVPAANPAGVTALRDLVRPGLRVALGARSSSIGRHARWVLSRQQLEVAPAVEAGSAAAVLAEVVAGRADAAIVYTTSARGVAGVATVAIPEAENTPVLYSIAAARSAPEPRGAAAFRALALGPVGQEVLAGCGFLAIGAK